MWVYDEDDRFSIYLKENKMTVEYIDFKTWFDSTYNEKKNTYTYQIAKNWAYLAWCEMKKEVYRKEMETKDVYNRLKTQGDSNVL